jgi:hypothetical protein
MAQGQLVITDNKIEITNISEIRPKERHRTLKQKLALTSAYIAR